MHLSGSPLLRGIKSDSCPSPPDAGSGFSVILRPGELTNNPGHDSLSLQRYSSHPATRLVTRPDDGEWFLVYNQNETIDSIVLTFSAYATTFKFGIANC